MTAQRAPLSDGRWHFQHGPIDIVIGADGEPDAVRAAHDAAWNRFTTILDELVAELRTLRLPVGAQCPLQGDIARRMWAACYPFRAGFITPMAAVAGAVAQELIASYEREGVSRAWVNNGGDIALHLAPGQSVRVGLYADLARLDAQQLRSGITTDGWFDVSHPIPVRGVATSGWRGRSFSLGIADSVTVLASTSAVADAAATVIANAVTIDDDRIVRRPACELKDDSDLGDIPVTVDVPHLDTDTVQLALRAGLRRARELRDAGLIWSCALVCQGVLMTTDEQLSPGRSEDGCSPPRGADAVLRGRGPTDQQPSPGRSEDSCSPPPGADAVPRGGRTRYPVAGGQQTRALMRSPAAHAIASSAPLSLDDRLTTFTREAAT